MGRLRDALRIGTGSAVPVPLDVLSPWSDGELSSIVWADLLNVDTLPLTRSEAMSVPAMARARHLIAGAVAGCPLVAYTGDVRQDPGPSWTYRTDGLVSPWHRMLWTVDDLIFHGFSLWSVVRGTEGDVLAAGRIPRDDWTVDDDGRVIVHGEPAPAARVVLIPGPHEGVLAFAARTLRAASKLERSAARHAANPVPSVELRQTLDVPITNTERDELISQWVAARSNPDTGAVGFTSYGIEAHPLGAVPEQLLIDGRNAAAVDVARHVSIPAAMLDATSAGASLTYETTEGRNGQFLDYGVSLYMDAITARLSLDDMIPRGSRVAFDTSGLASVTRDTSTEPVPD